MPDIANGGNGGNGGVRITNREIYDQLLSVERSVSILADAVQNLSDHETRLRVLEVNQADVTRIRVDLTKLSSSISKVVIGVSIAFVGAFIGTLFTLMVNR